MRKLAILCLALVALVVTAACGRNADSSDHRVSVVTSFDAMTELVKAVGGDKVAVHTVIPDGTEPHDFELKPSDVKTLQDARLFVYNGLGMEPWAQEAVEAAGNKDLIVLEASHGVDAIPVTEEDADHEGHDTDAKTEEHDHDHEHEHGHHHGSVDPHAWLSLKNAMIEVDAIAQALGQADPDNAAYYQENAARYKAELEALDQEYAAKFQALPRKDFVAGHAAFAYLCRDYGLRQESVEDVFAEGEPNAGQLAQLVNFAKDHGVKVIFSEEMASPDVSKTLAREVGAQVETLYTMESAEDNLSYLERMRSNLEKIYASLQ